MIKPVEYQVIISKTLDVAKVHNEENQKDIAMRYQQAVSTQQKAESSVKQVYSRSEAESVRIAERQKEGREGGENRKKKKNEEDKEKQEKNSLNSVLKTSTIDIKI